MTDLMFLLLMFLMVATTLISPNAIKVLLPKSNNQLKDKAYTTVTVTADDKYYVETTPVDFDHLEAAVQARVAETDNVVVSIHADQSVDWGQIVKVMNILIRNKYTVIAATAPE